MIAGWIVRSLALSVVALVSLFVVGLGLALTEPNNLEDHRLLD